MTETHDKVRGIFRQEFSTDNPEKCREIIEKLDCIQNRYQGNRVVRYVAVVGGVPVDIRSAPTRVVLISPSREALNSITQQLQDIFSSREKQ